MGIQVLYRLSDKSNPKNKIPNATNEHCLANTVNVFGSDNITVFADNCETETLDMIRGFGFEPIPISLGNAKSWRFVADYAIENFSDDQAIYFLEDDYLHLDASTEIILEGLAIADYVTLYDHPDKYMNPKEGGNAYVVNGGEPTRVLLTNSSHWKITNSSTMTFACYLKTLKKDIRVWRRFTSKKTPTAYKAFKRLASRGSFYNYLFGKNRLLISPIPARATHPEAKYLSPLVDWFKC